MDPQSVPRSTRFGEHMVSLNALHGLGFSEWVFLPGMLFNAVAKWWGDKGKRNRPHEGLDLCHFRIRDGEVRCLDDGAIVPVMFAGEVIKIGSDFLGQSVFVCHDIYNKRGEQLLTAYGHLKLGEGIYPGKVFKEGNLLGFIAGIENSTVEILPHLHISVAWISKSLRYEDIEWDSISDPGMAALLDPLKVINCRYSILT